MKKIILLILLITPLLAFGETELKPAPTERTIEAKEPLQINWGQWITLAPQYLVGIGAILAAMATLRQSKKALEQAEQESKRQYEIAQRQMKTPIIQEWINSFMKIYSELEYHISEYTYPGKKFNKEEYQDFIIILSKLRMMIDPEDKKSRRLIKALDPISDTIANDEELNDPFDEIRPVAYSIIESERSKIIKYDNEPSS